MRRRQIMTDNPPGDIPREKIRAVIQAPHVRKADSGWEVRILGPKGTSESFSSKGDAVSYAKKITPNHRIAVHDSDGAKLIQAEVPNRQKKISRHSASK